MASDFLVELAALLVMGPDLLAPYARNEPCWCGSRRKYKYCHGDHYPPSTPGAPIPPDSQESIFLTPTTAVAKDVLSGVATAGVPITMPTGRPVPGAIRYTNWEQHLGAGVSADQEAMIIEDVGALRVEVLRRIAGLSSSNDPPPDEMRRALFELTAETIRAVERLATLRPRRTLFWNEELDVPRFLGRTLFLADHVLYPDLVFDVMLREGSSADLKRESEGQLQNAELLATGMAIPVPPGVAMATRGRAAIDLTAADLNNANLVAWVRRQLILEGPTAREALFVRAADDLATDPALFWLHGRIDRTTVDAESGKFTSRLLHPYEPGYDYGPWIEQVKDSAVSALVQRTNERVIAADVFGAEYISASLFEARLLRNRGRSPRIGPGQAALWADIPELPDLTSPDLASILKHEGAIEDLRRQVRAALATARSDADNIDAITDLAHGLETASHRLQRTAVSDRTWQGAIPAGLGTASIVIGGITGGLAGLGVGALGALAGVAPYLSTRFNARRDAAYLFVAARRRRR